VSGGAHCPQVASRVFYQLSEWKAFDENAPQSHRAALQHVSAALQTLIGFWKRDFHLF
jgi:hypothetical protein